MSIPTSGASNSTRRPCGRGRSDRSCTGGSTRTTSLTVCTACWRGSCRGGIPRSHGTPARTGPWPWAPCRSRGPTWRLTEDSYPCGYVKDQRLYDLIDTAVAVQAEYQLQFLLMDREFTRVVATLRRGVRMAEGRSGGPGGLLGDILGIVSAVAGAWRSSPSSPRSRGRLPRSPQSPPSAPTRWTRRSRSSTP